MKSYNQAGQEVWVREILNNKNNGFFVDVGAYDGVESSNTYFLEKELLWDGLCIEANPNFYANLIKNRSCKTTNKAVMPYSGFCVFNGINTYPSQNGSAYNSVSCDLLDSILTLAKCPSSIDYMSLDIEGHEYNVLASFPFSKWDVNLFTIEHNSYLVGPTQKNLIYHLMSSKGYTRVVEDVKCPTGPYEDWYKKNKS
jgi:FkbM family methyltransferase